MREVAICNSVTSLFLLGFFVVGSQAFAEQQQAIVSPELEEAQKKQAIAEAEKATAEAERDAFKAKLGELSTDKVEKSTITTDKLVIEGKLLAYESAEAAAKAIVKGIYVSAKAKGKLVIATEQLNDIVLYRAFMTQIELMLNNLTPLMTMPKLLTEPLPSPCPPQIDKSRFVPPLAVATVALQLISLLKVDTTVKGIETSINEFGLAALIAAELISKEIDVAYPSRFYTAAFAPIQNPTIVARINELSTKKFNLDRFLDLVIKKKGELKTLATTSSNECKKLYSEDIETLEKLETAIKSTITNLQGVLDQFMKVGNTTGVTLLHQLSSAEVLQKNYQGATILEVKPVEAGGAFMTKAGIFGTSLRFSGGVVIAYMLFDGENGKILASGLISRYSGYIKDSDIDQKLSR